MNDFFEGTKKAYKWWDGHVMKPIGRFLASMLLMLKFKWLIILTSMAVHLIGTILFGILVPALLFWPVPPIRVIAVMFFIFTWTRAWGESVTIIQKKWAFNVTK